MKTIFLFLALAIASLSASAHHLPGYYSHARNLTGYYFELVDFGVEPDHTSTSGGCSIRRPTPMTITGAKTVNTYDVERMLKQGGANETTIIDVENFKLRQAFAADNEIIYPDHESLPGAIWLPGAGAKLASKMAFENKSLAIKAQLLTHLNRLSGSNKAASLLFTNSGYDCWMGYNAALFAVENGYTNVLWYRGGLKSWLAANHPPSIAQRIDWLPESIREEARIADEIADKD
jgi:PQQ-dependent catabolism-associated CXXCW motif protein